MLSVCKVAWCVGVVLEGSKYCRQHIVRPALHDRESRDEYVRRLRKEDGINRRRMTIAAKHQATAKLRERV